MKNLKKNYTILEYLIISFLYILIISRSVYANDILFHIKGNDFTDSEVIISLLDNIPKEINEEYSNDIIKILNDSNLFSDVRVEISENKYVITVKEFPSIRKINFKNNERLKDEELELIASEMKLINFNQQSITLFINEIKKIYQSFGYNNVNIEFSENINFDNNSVELNFQIDEGKITKINKIIISGNDSVLAQDIF